MTEQKIREGTDLVQGGGPDSPAPLVTIAIPTVSRLNYLKEAVHSALAQTYPQIEILISDDGGNGELRTWGETLADTESRVRYCHTPRSLGLAGNWNFCVERSRGSYLMIIGDDDRLLPECVTRLVAQSNGAEVTFSNHFLIDSIGNRSDRQTREFTEISGRAGLGAGRLKNPEVAIWRNSIPISSALLRVDRIKELKFKEDLNTPEIEYFLRLAASGGDFVFCPEYLVEYRVHYYSETSKGLWSDRIAPYLIEFPTSPEAEPLKRQLIESLLPNAVGRAISSGNRQEARKLLSSSYYPEAVKKSALGRLQSFCLTLPPLWAKLLYQSLRSLLRR